ncbi:MAG: protein kinase [Chloroflexaceae bacterium]|nr:protein kinase [Chloroflexaceae bacterium]
MDQIDQLIGRQFGRYTIQQEIGRGGMARVYRALDTRLHRPVALKVMAPHLNADPEYLRRFVREARLAAKLHHPGIVSVYDVDEQDGLRYIAMEFIEGRSLYSVLKEHGAMGLGCAVSILEPVGQALDYAHQKGAIHRDVKPHNVLIAVDGRVLLTDFGIALPLDGGRERLTRTGIFMGTPEYISPEQIESRYVDGRSDLYSLGIVAYEMITGRVPFTGTTPQLIAAHAQTPPPLPGSVVPTLPRELDPVFARILAKDPQSRFPDGGAMVDALRRVARRYGMEMVVPAEIATLAVPGGASVGKATIPEQKSFDPTPVGSHPPVAIRLAAPPGASGRPEQVAAAPQYGPAPEYPEPGGAYREGAAAEREPPRRLNPVAFWMGMVVIIGLVVVLVVASLFRGCGAGAAPPVPTEVSPPVPAPTPAVADSPVLEPTPHHGSHRHHHCCHD